MPRQVDQMVVGFLIPGFFLLFAFFGMKDDLQVILVHFGDFKMNKFDPFSFFQTLLQNFNFGVIGIYY